MHLTRQRMINHINWTTDKSYKLITNKQTRKILHKGKKKKNKRLIHKVAILERKNFDEAYQV